MNLLAIISTLPFLGSLLFGNFHAFTQTNIPTLNPISQIQIHQSPPPKICRTLNSLNISVDQDNKIPSDFVPDDLVLLSNFGIPTIGEQTLRAEAAKQLAQMRRSLLEKNLDFVIDSAYRSQDSQSLVYANTGGSNVMGAKTAAEPGQSEHQLGTAVDIKLSVKSPIYPSPTWTWLDQNAHKFGFVMSYRLPHQDLTGIRFEPWHWRYVGVDLATEIRYSSDPPQTHYQKIGC